MTLSDKAWNTIENSYHQNNSLIDKINAQQEEARIMRIKLKFLTNRFTNLAKGMHDMQMIFDKTEHNNIDWKLCDSPLCKSNNEVLEKFGDK